MLANLKKYSIELKQISFEKEKKSKLKRPWSDRLYFSNDNFI